MEFGFEVSHAPTDPHIHLVLDLPPSAYFETDCYG